ncbi:hypothetical protein [Halovivax sp.]|uniref:hypothetical protein n=1 Tax=Halovivax sp. TaxID=1935978 RepID=UPI0025BE600D|nr:hypothetical protein [Halovivax sp.]
MTDSPHSTAADSEPDSIDPATLRERPDVVYEEATAVYDDLEDFERGVRDTAVVGVTNGEGEVCCFVNEGRGFAGLPWEPVSDDNWLDAAYSSIEDWCTGTGLAISIDGAELVRRVEHEVVGDDEPRAATHTILFRASPVEADPALENLAGSDDWDAGWYDGVPDAAPATPDEVADDIRRFVG